jgi:hypothetical protein
MSARTLISVVGLALLWSGWLAGVVQAASNQEVSYRLTNWKAAHFNSEKDANKVLQTLKQLGCEARQEAHNGHTDVIYRCPSWRVHKAKSHDEAHQWEHWFKTYGFETKHEH